MVFLLPLVYLLCHGLAILAFPGHAQPLSFAFLTAAPLIAGFVCARHCRGSDVADSWAAVALGMLLWAGGMAVNMVQEVFLANADSTPGASMLLYVLYGVPLVFVLGSAEKESWYVKVVDGVLAVMLGYLFFIHTFTFATASNATGLGVIDIRRMFDIENIFIALFAAVRYVASRDTIHREFFRALTIFACMYLVVAFYINHVEPQDADFGNIADLLIDVPFLVLAAIAARRKEPVTQVGADSPRRLAHIVSAGSPLMLPVTLLVISAMIAHSHLNLAVAGFVAATLGYGLRSVLTQVRSFERQDQLGTLARIDALTGLPNRRQFEETLGREWNRACRSGDGIALLLIDVDHFKLLNDKFGHQAGDLSLRAVAQALARSVARPSDVVARHGGEEFAVVLPSITIEGAGAIAEIMRVSVERLQLAAPTPHSTVTVSIGVGFIRPGSADDSTELIAATDRALYEAKHAGRNRVAQHDLSVHSP